MEGLVLGTDNSQATRLHQRHSALRLWGVCDSPLEWDTIYGKLLFCVLQTFYMMIPSLNDGYEDSCILKSPSCCKIHKKYSAEASVLWEPLHMDPRAVKGEAIDVKHFLLRRSRKQLSETKTIRSLIDPGPLVSPCDSGSHAPSHGALSES